MCFANAACWSLSDFTLPGVQSVRYPFFLFPSPIKHIFGTSEALPHHFNVLFNTLFPSHPRNISTILTSCTEILFILKTVVLFSPDNRSISNRSISREALQDWKVSSCERGVSVKSLTLCIGIRELKKLILSFVYSSTSTAFNGRNLQGYLLAPVTQGFFFILVSKPWITYGASDIYCRTSGI